MVKTLPAIATDISDTGSIPGFPWRRKWQPTPIVLAGESHGQRTLVGYSPRGHRESDPTEQVRYSMRYPHNTFSLSSLVIYYGEEGSKIQINRSNQICNFL